MKVELLKGSMKGVMKVKGKRNQNIERGIQRAAGSRLKKGIPSGNEKYIYRRYTNTRNPG